MKISKPYILVSILITIVINIMFIFFISYKHLQETYDIISNNLYFENKVIIQNEEPINWDTEKFTGKYRIIAEINKNSRLIIADTTNWIPPLRLGYYPKAASVSVPRSAIIGKNLQNNSLSNVSKNSIKYFDKTFKITGIIGTEYITLCDDLVILFGLKYEDLKPYAHQIIIDSPDEYNINQIIKQIELKYPNTIISQTESKGTARITKTSYFCKLLYFELLSLTFFTLLFIAIYFHAKSRNKTFVYYLLGLSTTRILFFSVFEIILTNIISFILSFLIALYIFEFSKVQLYNYFLSYVLYTLLEVIVIIILYYLQLRKLMVIQLNRKEKRKNDTSRNLLLFQKK